MSEEFTYESYVELLRNQSQRAPLSNLDSGILHSHGQAQQITALRDKIKALTEHRDKLLAENADLKKQERIKISNAYKSGYNDAKTIILETINEKCLGEMI